MIETALSHLEKTGAGLRKDSKNIGSNEELAKIVTELEEIDKQIERLESERDDAIQQLDAVKSKFSGH